MIKMTHFSVDFFLWDSGKSAFPQVVKKLAVANLQKSGLFLSSTLNRPQTEERISSQAEISGRNSQESSIFSQIRRSRGALLIASPWVANFDSAFSQLTGL